MSTTTDAPQAPRSPLSFLAHAVATGFGAGHSPVIPGTAGSAVGLLLYWPLAPLGTPAQLAAIVVVLLLGIGAAEHVARRVGLEDPSLVVVDEIVGQWITLVFLPFTPLTAALGFVLFRVMDVVKPWPARQLEHLHGGFGIMADDVMAGIYANLALRVLLLALPLA